MSGFKIKIFTADGVQMVSVAKPHLLIGHSEHCDVRINQQEIGEEHLRIWSDGGHLWGQDLGSASGTTVNGQLLQPMRPFLFHETDSFKLGESGVSLAFALNLGSNVVRAPQLVPKPPEPEETTSTDVKRLMHENDKLSRELQKLRDQLRNAVPASPEEEEEVSQVKLNALHEINAMKEAEARRFETWKRESVDEIEKMVISVVERIPKGRLSKSEICHDISATLRKTLLNGEGIPSKRKFAPMDESSSKFIIPLVLAAVLCCGYAAYSKWTAARRRPASTVVYVPPPARPVLVQKPKVSAQFTGRRRSRR